MQDRSQGFEQEWRFELRCRRAMATKKMMQKAWRRLTDFVGHPQIEAEPLQNQSGSLLGCSEAIWDRPLMLQGRLPEAPGCSWDASSPPGTHPGHAQDSPKGCRSAWVMFQAAAPTFRCVKRLRRRHQKRRNALSH